MRLRCKTAVPSREELVKLGPPWATGQAVFHAVIEREYLVFGLSVFGGNLWADVLAEGGYLVCYPFFLFDIVDGRVSRYWEAVASPDVFRVAPPLLHGEFFFDDLLENVPAAEEAFEILRKQMEDEFEPRSPEAEE